MGKQRELIKDFVAIDKLSRGQLRPIYRSDQKTGFVVSCPGCYNIIEAPPEITLDVESKTTSAPITCHDCGLVMRLQNGEWTFITKHGNQFD